MKHLPLILIVGAVGLMAWALWPAQVQASEIPREAPRDAAGYELKPGWVADLSWRKT
jgi:hypothetical protein